MSRLFRWLRWPAFVAAITMAVTPAAFGLLSWWLAWQPEHKPVVDRFTVESIERLPSGDIELAGHFYKLYRDHVCRFERLRFFALRDGQLLRVGRPAPSSRELVTQFLDRRAVEEDNNRGRGYNPFYGWQIGTSEWPEARAVQGRVYHTCFGVVPFVTDLPPVAFGPEQGPLR